MFIRVCIILSPASFPLNMVISALLSTPHSMDGAFSIADREAGKKFFHRSTLSFETVILPTIEMKSFGSKSPNSQMSNSSCIGPAGKSAEERWMVAFPLPGQGCSLGRRMPECPLPATHFPLCFQEDNMMN